AVQQAVLERVIVDETREWQVPSDFKSRFHKEPVERARREMEEVSGYIVEAVPALPEASRLQAVEVGQRDKDPTAGTQQSCGPLQNLLRTREMLERVPER